MHLQVEPASEGEEAADPRIQRLISDKIDDLSERMRRLDHGLLRSSEDPRARVVGINKHETISARNSEPEAIESTLFAHVLHATKFVQAAVANDRHSDVSDELELALDALQNAVQIQKHQNESLESSRPFSKDLPPGIGFKDLPMPPIDRIMAVLRLAHESSPSQLYWPFEFGSPGDFTKYVIKACSPGPVTEAELIIVHYVLFWLFTECSITAGDESIRQDYAQQAGTCRNSLETILSNLSIHLPDNVDSVCATYMATLYCLQQGKPFTAWTFISRSSLTSQALGLHSLLVVSTEQAEEAQRRRNLFWAVYVLEKAVSLRLGRPSTIRDRDITIPRLRLDRNMTSLSHNKLPDWIEMAELYGRVYDDIYSSHALSQPLAVRESRIKSLASELERMMAIRNELYKHPMQWSAQSLPTRLYKLAVHANKATDYSILASIYRGVVRPTASGKPSMTPCTECISAARAALDEAKACIAVLTDPLAVSPPASLFVSLGSWISEVVQTATFIPFLILFCNTVETSASCDLDRLQYLVDGLQSIVLARPSGDPASSACGKQLRIFKALYDVAAKYVETKSGNARPWAAAAGSGQSPLNINSGSHRVALDTVLFGTDAQSSSLLEMPKTRFSAHAGNSFDRVVVPEALTETMEDEGHHSADQAGDCSLAEDPLLFQTPMEMPELDNYGMDVELDIPGTELESWFHQSHQMMRLLEGSP
ncbi:fungal specific transcription factor domain-containing protein [Aspergillus mulundensis]|uniref:Xylanolytic transcriptional activator regulatory domain-containing protein n=1 Tax=Aspergillus mulundensis TaxID=1810919 RepID=A0A3D8T309_9EURO|nr:hypothetical protein DSM5745_00242 [Aspergillus mulundensis]RDW92920.1 hypothetical protein DSM5745_00242 [Aspergillus mulundensis]